MSVLGYTGIQPVQSQGAARERLPLISVLVAVFIIGAVTVTTRPGWNVVVKVSGVVLAVAFIISLLRTRVRLAPEAIFYFAWVTWSLVGVVGVRSSFLFWEQWFTVFQISILISIMVGFSTSHRTFAFSLLAFIAGFLVLTIYANVSGQYVVAEGGGRRLGSLVGNPNEFAWVVILSTVAMAYFWMRPTRLAWLKYALIIAGMIVGAVSSVLSGSRMGLVGMVFFYAAWIWFCYRGALLRRPRVLAVVILAAAVGGYFFVTYASESAMWERIQASVSTIQTGRDPEGSTQTRLLLLSKAWSVIMENPLQGVGLDNFQLFSGSYQFMAHSDYAEVATSTGLPGLALYVAIPVILWIRCGKIRKYSGDPQLRDTAGLVRATLVVLLATNLGNVVYFNKATWIILGCMIGYTHAVWYDLRSRMVPPAPAAALGPTSPLLLR